MTRTAKPKPSRVEKAKRKAQWYRAVAIASLSESDLYCICCDIERASPDLIQGVQALEEAYPAPWDNIGERRQAQFDPSKATSSCIVVNVNLTVDMSEPLGPQTAIQLRRVSEQLLTAAADVERNQDYRDIGAIKKLSAGRLDARIDKEGYVQVLTKSGKIVPCEEREI